MSFRFFDTEKNHPDVHSLVKFYMDALQGIAFEDDRQVYYLEAFTSRLRSEKHGSSVLIEVRRLVDYQRWVELGSKEEPDIDDRVGFPFHIYLPDQRYWDIAESQYKALSHSRICSHDHLAQRAGIPTIIDTLVKEAHSLFFDLGVLPVVEGTSGFKAKVVDILAKYAVEGRLFSHIYIPVELNAQITKQGFGLAKDLDNLMRLICPLIREKLLYRKSHINGYRAYVIDDEAVPPRLSIQLLPPGAIEEYNDRIEAGFEAYGKGLEDYI